MGTIAVVVSVAGTLIAIVAAIGTPIIKLTSAISSLTTVVAQLKEMLDSDRVNNEKAHEKIYQRLDTMEQKQDDVVQIVTRLEVLEESRGNK